MNKHQENVIKECEARIAILQDIISMQSKLKQGGIYYIKTNQSRNLSATKITDKWNIPRVREFVVRITKFSQKTIGVTILASDNDFMNNYNFNPENQAIAYQHIESFEEVSAETAPLYINLAYVGPEFKHLFLGVL